MKPNELNLNDLAPPPRVDILSTTIPCATVRHCSCPAVAHTFWNRKQNILFHIAFALLCVGSLFSTQAKIYDALIQSKWFAFYLIVCSIGFLLGYSQKKGYTFRIADMAVGIIIVYLSIHHLLSNNLVDFWINLLPILSLYYIFRLRGCCLSFKAVAWIMLLCSLGLSVWGLSQIDSWESLRSNTTFTGPFESCAAYAVSLVLCLPFILYLLLHNQKYKVLTVVALLLTIVLIVLSQSRMAWLSALAIGIFLFFCSKRSVGSIKPAVKWSLSIVITTLSIFVYFIRPESANGRLFIWFNTLSLYTRNLLFGNGYNTFRRDYMVQQADFFRAYPESKFSMVADNVSHPFNEYLNLLVQWGAVGALLLAILVFILITAWKKNRSAESDITVACLLAIAVSSCVSYPFCYPFTWVVLILCVSRLAEGTKEIRTFRSSISCLLPICFVVGIGMYGNMYYHHHEWYNASKLYNKDSQTAIQHYQALATRLHSDPYFLYNHAAILYDAGYYERCLHQLEACGNLLNDYDVVMLKGMAYKSLEHYDDALTCFRLASNMCPSKFMPLYQAFETLALCGREKEAKALCKRIIEKPVKIDSDQVRFIKAKCSAY